MPTLRNVKIWELAETATYTGGTPRPNPLGCSRDPPDTRPRRSPRSLPPGWCRCCGRWLCHHLYFNNDKKKHSRFRDQYWVLQSIFKCYRCLRRQRGYMSDQWVGSNLEGRTVGTSPRHTRFQWRTWLRIVFKSVLELKRFIFHLEKFTCATSKSGLVGGLGGQISSCLRFLAAVRATPNAKSVRAFENMLL